MRGWILRDMNFQLVYCFHLEILVQFQRIIPDTNRLANMRIFKPSFQIGILSPKLILAWRRYYDTKLTYQFYLIAITHFIYSHKAFEAFSD